MQVLSLGQYKREGDIATIQNESISQVLLCISLRICQVLKWEYNSLRADPVHIRALIVAGVEYFQGGC